MSLDYKYVAWGVETPPSMTASNVTEGEQDEKPDTQGLFVSDTDSTGTETGLVSITKHRLSHHL